jgi:ubiquinone/menaquinone biosynthesis C-methylase UbiE
MSSEIDPTITSYYDRWREESRLSQGASRLEEARTRELILRHAPAPPAIVLDVGGAAGVYAFWLAERGYDVRLIDASPRLVEVARQRNENADHRLASCEVGDARKLRASDESSNIVLLLGPLYHLVNERDRHAALAECFRVLRPGGMLFAAGISRFASLLDGLARELLKDDGFSQIVERDLADGNHLNPTNHIDYFTTAYLHRPEDMRSEVVNAGFGQVDIYGIEGPGWTLPDFDDRWDDPARRKILLRVARVLESEPAVVGCSAHLLAVGRKPER